MVSVRPLSFTQFGGGGGKERRTELLILSTTVVKPVDNADILGLRTPKFLDVGEYLLPFFLPGSFVCVLKVVYNLGHYQFRLKGGEAQPPSAHL